MTTAVALVGGWAHPAEQTGPPLAAALAACGVTATVVDDSEHAAAALGAERPDLLVVHTCRFQMLDDRYTAEQRRDFAELTPVAWRAAVRAHLSAERPLLALHTAPISFDDWPLWPDLGGATWQWDRSNHPPPGPFVVTPVADHAVSRGLAPFTVVDELYRFVTPAAGAEVVAHATDTDGTAHPQVWLHHVGSARVAYDALGHDERSLGDPAHRALLARLVAWLAGVPTEET